MDGFYVPREINKDIDCPKKWYWGEFDEHVEELQILKPRLIAVLNILYRMSDH